MDRHRPNAGLWLLFALACLVICAVPTLARDRAPTDADAPATKPVRMGGIPTGQDAQPMAPGGLRAGVAGPASGDQATTAARRDLLPRPDHWTLTWFAVLLILVLMVQTQPLFTLRNLDALTLAGACVLLAFRGDSGRIEGDPTGFSLQGWSYLLLSVIAAYWLLRGIGLMRAVEVRPAQPNVSEGALLVLVAAGLLLAFGHVARAPLSTSIPDVTAGSAYLNATGTLPYGELPGAAARSPLLIAAHAGVARLAQPLTDDSAPTWSNRERWQSRAVLTDAELLPTRLLCGLLTVLTLAAVVAVGNHLHSVNVGLSMMVILCVFPGAWECFNAPEIMLPTALLAWSLYFSLLPGIGGLLCMVTLVAAGLANPWLWLGVPPAMAYFLRKGWSGVGAAAGLLGGVVAVLYCATQYVQPALPQVDGSLRAAGVVPQFVATLGADQKLQIVEKAGSPVDGPAWHAPLWNFLLNSERVSASGTAQTPIRLIAAEGAAREPLQDAYREAIAAQPEDIRMWVALRTMLEAAWLSPEAVSLSDGATDGGTWAYWAAGGDAERWTMIRRSVKGAAGLLAVVLAVALLRTREPRPHHLIGALAAVFSLALAAGRNGAAAEWAWILPVLLATVAVKSTTSRRPYLPTAPAAGRAPAQAAPRISVNN